MSCSRRRRGFSLIEVIVCTGIVAVMVVPIAGVIRASGQSIAQADGSVSVEANLRTGLRWVSQAIRDGDIVSVRGRRLTIRMPDNSLADIEMRRGNLVLVSGADVTVLTEGIRDVRFLAVNRVSPPVSRTGIVITLQSRDASGGLITIDTTIAHRPQN